MDFFFIRHFCINFNLAVCISVVATILVVSTGSIAASYQRDQWFETDLSLESRDALVESSKEDSFNEIAPILIEVISSGPGDDYITPGLDPRDKPWNDPRHSSKTRTFLMAGAVWYHHIDHRGDEATSKILLRLLQQANNAEERRMLVHAIRFYRWNSAAERPIAVIAMDQKNPLALRTLSAGALLTHCDVNLYMPLAEDLIRNPKSKTDQARLYNTLTNLGNRLFSLNEDNKRSIVSMGFDILTALPEKNLRDGYFVALRIGFVLKIPTEFKPDQSAEEYQGPNGLRDEFFEDTVRNALDWHAENWQNPPLSRLETPSDTSSVGRMNPSIG